MSILAYGTTYKELVEFPAPREGDRWIYLCLNLFKALIFLFPAPLEVDR